MTGFELTNGSVRVKSITLSTAATAEAAAEIKRLQTPTDPGGTLARSGNQDWAGPLGRNRIHRQVSKPPSPSNRDQTHALFLIRPPKIHPLLFRP